MIQKRKNIDSYRSRLAILIAFLALFVSSWQLVLTYDHNKLSVKPSLHITPKFELGSGKTGLFIENSGLGPGIIKEFEVQTPEGAYSGFTNQWKEIEEKNKLPLFCFAKGWPDKEATIKPGDEEYLLSLSESASDACILSIGRLFQRDDVIIKIVYESMYEEEFQVQRSFDIGSKELETFQSIVNKYMVN